MICFKCLRNNVNIYHDHLNDAIDVIMLGTSETIAPGSRRDVVYTYAAIGCLVVATWAMRRASDVMAPLAEKYQDPKHKAPRKVWVMPQETVSEAMRGIPLDDDELN